LGQAYNEMSYADVAPAYNAINAIPPAAAARLAEAVAALTGARARVLDLGGGAGRISVPVSALTELVSVDLELEMLKVADRLARASSRRLGLAAADLLQLPFANNTFDAALTANVLHQVAGWRQALVEAARVLKPEGLLIFGRDLLDEKSCAGRLRSQARRIGAELAPGMRPTDAAGPALFQELAKLGGRPEAQFTACEWTETLSPQDVLQRMAERTHNETWALSEAHLSGLMARIQPWAEDEFAELDAPETVHWSFALVAVRGLA